MRRQDEFDLEDRPSFAGGLAAVIGALAAVIVLIAGVCFLLFGGDREQKPEAVVGESVMFSSESVAESNSIAEENDTNQAETGEALPENQSGQGKNDMLPGESAEKGQESSQEESHTQETEPVRILVSDNVKEIQRQTLGIDVSKYQGNIDWEQVAAAGIEFAMIRVGYRTMGSGEILEDESAKYNLQEATAHGIKAGAYFFSTAISEEEALEEARWLAEYIGPYRITYPVAYNCEGYDKPDSRQASMTREERSALAKVFLDEIYEQGYTPMFYASKGELEGDSEWLASELEKSYKIWISWYPEKTYPDTPEVVYAGSSSMWQYTNSGKVPGIDYPVDRNVADFGYESEAEPKTAEAPEYAEKNIEAGHSFAEVSETITAKEATNLRNIPSQGEDSRIMYTLRNGETAVRTGISSSGWSRVEFGGETYYAVSSYLTTDLTPKEPKPESAPENGGSDESEIRTQFIPRDEMVTPKEEVNLRTLPSVTNPESLVVVKLPYGSAVKRTGINEELGWSRVEYEGQTLYCVSSYVFVVENTAE